MKLSKDFNKNHKWAIIDKYLDVVVFTSTREEARYLKCKSDTIVKVKFIKTRQ